MHCPNRQFERRAARLRSFSQDMGSFSAAKCGASARYTGDAGLKANCRWFVGFVPSTSAGQAVKELLSCGNAIMLVQRMINEWTCAEAVEGLSMDRKPSSLNRKPRLPWRLTASSRSCTTCFVACACGGTLACPAPSGGFPAWSSDVDVRLC